MELEKFLLGTAEAAAAMTVKEVQDWRRENKFDARGFVRGAEFSFRDGDGSPSHSLDEVLHWEVTVNGEKLLCSPSDMLRLVAGKISLENFVQAMSRAVRRGGE